MKNPRTRSDGDIIWETTKALIPLVKRSKPRLPETRFGVHILCLWKCRQSVARWEMASQIARDVVGTLLLQILAALWTHASGSSENGAGPVFSQTKNQDLCIIDILHKDDYNAGSPNKAKFLDECGKLCSNGGKFLPFLDCWMKCSVSNDPKLSSALCMNCKTQTNPVKFQNIHASRGFALTGLSMVAAMTIQQEFKQVQPSCEKRRSCMPDLSGL